MHYYSKLCTAVLTTVLLVVVSISAASQTAPLGVRRQAYVVDSDVSSLVYPATASAIGQWVVKGYHPYWIPATNHRLYDWSALSHMAYFSVELDTANGRVLNRRSWPTALAVTETPGTQTSLLLTVTNFGAKENEALLLDSAKRRTMAQTIIAEASKATVRGVSIDFEALSTRCRAPLVDFLKDMRALMTSHNPPWELHIACPAVDWSEAFDIAQIATLCDYLIVMGYDYYWSGSESAGPVAPLRGGSFNLEKSVARYLELGSPRSKLVLGLPWYGYEWPVRSASPRSATTGSGRAVSYERASALTASAPGLDTIAWSRYRTYTDTGGVLRQVWFDDSLTLSKKYDFAKAMSLAGVALWALGYQGRSAELWEGLKSVFAVSSGAWIDQSGAFVNVSPNPVARGSMIRISNASGSLVRLVSVLGEQTLLRGSEPEVYDIQHHDVLVHLPDSLPAGTYLLQVSHITRGPQSALVVIE